MIRNPDGSLACICHHHKPECDCMPRNYGLGPSERFPDGCDWHKPPGCSCRLQSQREACYEDCDDMVSIESARRERFRRRFGALFLFIGFAVASVMVVLTSAGWLK